LVQAAVEHIFFFYREGEYGWLSNFWRCPQVVGELLYPTNEHFYQSEKAADPQVKAWIIKAPSPYLAMKAGRSLRRKEMVENWDEIKVSVMLRGLRAKFKDPILRQRLLGTGNALLHEESPNDLFWGVKGQDMLGKLLVQVRSEIRAGRVC